MLRLRGLLLWTHSWYNYLTDVPMVRFFMGIMTTTGTSLSSEYRYSERDFDGYSAAPLLIIGEDADPELVKRQNELAGSFTQLVDTELGGVAKPNVTQFVAQSIISRMHQREGLNGSSYLNRPNDTPHFVDHHLSGEEIIEACDHLRQGTGSVLQNEIARKAFGMTSVEYANLTIVGDARKQLERPMWDEVSELTGGDAMPHAKDVYSFKVLEFDRDIRSDMNIGAMRIGMKRHLGTTEYGAEVKVRTTAIIKPTALFRHMGKTHTDYRDFTSKLQEAAQFHKDFSHVPEFSNAIEWLIESSLPPEIVLARNETVYGFES